MFAFKALPARHSKAAVYHRWRAHATGSLQEIPQGASFAELPQRAFLYSCEKLSLRWPNIFEEITSHGDDTELSCHQREIE